MIRKFRAFGISGRWRGPCWEWLQYLEGYTTGDARSPAREDMRKKAKTVAVVRLTDLAPRNDPTGGAGKLRFGEPSPPPTAEEPRPAEQPDPPVKKAAAWKRTPRKDPKGRTRDLS